MIDGTTAGGLLWRLRRLVVGSPATRVQFECRRCGHTLAKAADHCPACGAADVARYEL